MRLKGQQKEVRENVKRKADSSIHRGINDYQK